jgi:hypothetical protein
VALRADRTEVDACVTTAFASHRAFFAQYDAQGIDSSARVGIAGDRAGNVTYLQWDSDPSGGGDIGAVVNGNRCIGPSVDSSPTRDLSAAGPLSCTSTVSLGRTCE